MARYAAPAARRPVLVEVPRSVVDEQRAELLAHRAEAVAFVNGVMEPASRLAYAATFLDPLTHQAGRQLLERLARYRDRHVVEVEA